MPKKTSNAIPLYWDACIFLSAINANKDRLPVITSLLDDCDAGNLKIFTSYLSITEVAFAESEKKDAVLDDAIEDKINKLWQPPSPINLIEVDPFIIWDAKALMRQAIKRGWGLKPADAIHLATAQRVKVDYFHTYDTDKLAKYAELTTFTIEAPKTNRFEFPQENNDE
jgi:predicted nucleic acid-binding protein